VIVFSAQSYLSEAEIRTAGIKLFREAFVETNSAYRSYGSARASVGRQMLDVNFHAPGGIPGLTKPFSCVTLERTEVLKVAVLN
jgi:hypothetical protein